MNKELARCIGTAARAARKAGGMTQEDVAERIDVSVEFYARIERGNSLPSIITFARLVVALGVSADALLGRQPVSLQPHVVGQRWMGEPRQDSRDIRRLMRRLRKATPGTLRLVNTVLREIDRLTADRRTGGGDESSP